MSSTQDLPAVAERFLRYVQIDTEADRHSTTTPSSAKQKDLSRLLTEELRALGVDAEMDDYGYVYAGLPSTLPAAEAAVAPVVAFFAHVDTSPDEPGGPVKPQIHRDYDGSVIPLPGDSSVKLDPSRSPALLEHVGHDVISSDGTTLLGSDDKAGVAVIMQLAADLVADPGHPRPTLRFCFTVDEEIGRGVDKLDLERLDADVGYTIDGGPVGELDIETFNAAEAVVTVGGLNVHPGTAKGVMANAVAVLVDYLSCLPASETPETTEGGEGYFFAHEIEGTVTHAVARILVRDFTDEGFAKRQRFLHRLKDVIAAKYPRATVEVEIEESYRNMKSYIEAKDPRAIAFAFAAAREMGMEMTGERVRGFTGGYDYHSRFEWNTVQNLEASLAYVKELVRYWAEHGRDE